MKKIFLFEDEIGLAYYFKEGLKSAGYDVYLLKTVAGLAVDSNWNDEFSMFILDIMGDQKEDEGLEFAERLRKEKIKIPIIFSSVLLIKPELIDRAQRVENSDHLVRPHSIKSLLEKIHQLLEGVRE